MEPLKAVSSQRKSVADLGAGTQANAEVSSSDADSRMERLKAFASQRKSVADLGAGTQANAEVTEVSGSDADSRMERLKAFASQRKSVADLGAGTQANAEVSSSDADSRMEQLKTVSSQRKSVADLGAGTQANAEVSSSDADSRMERLKYADLGAGTYTNVYDEVDVIPDQNDTIQAKACAASKAADNDRAGINDPFFSLKLRRLALSVCASRIGVSVRALSEHADEIDGSGTLDDSSAFLQVLSSKEVGPAEFYVIHDSAAPLRAIIPSLVTFVSPVSNGLETFVWVDVVCLPRIAQKTRFMVSDMRITMAEIGKVIICIESLAQLTQHFKHSWFLYQIHVASSVGCRFKVVSSDVQELQSSLLDDSSWDNVKPAPALHNQ
jgi:hypothetical protein